LKYLCLIYLDESHAGTRPQGSDGRIVEECSDYVEELKARGRYIASAALQPVQTAVTVRALNGKVSLADGPFAGTKEQLAGFYLIEARDLNQAIQVASRIPAARLGCIEVRPTVDEE
jgi:hypothetical protein